MAPYFVEKQMQVCQILKYKLQMSSQIMVFFGNNLLQNCFIPSNFESSEEFEDLSNLSTLKDNVFFLVISFRGSDVLVVFGEAISTASIFLTLKSMASLLHSGKFAKILFTLFFLFIYFLHVGFIPFFVFWSKSFSGKMRILRIENKQTGQLIFSFLVTLNKK